MNRSAARINRLAPQDIARIAAGEVIERPVSVVKELVENAIDAGARRIDVSIAEGGLRSIEVADDGGGIAAADLQVALERHATSKLRAFADLEHVRSLGFRGEALASIAAASQLRIVSRTPDASAAAVIETESGEARRRPDVARAVGTTVSVESLFASTPARLRFLASPAAEAARIARLVQHVAQVYPAIAFCLTNQGKVALRTDGQGDVRSVLAVLYRGELAGRALLLDGAEGSVGGVVCHPADATWGRAMTTLAVNGRLVQQRSFVHAVEEAYGGLMRSDQHPLAVITLRVDPELLDVNVHPSKAEIRFRGERDLFSQIQRAVRAALLSEGGADVTRSWGGTLIDTPMTWSPAPHQPRLDAPAVSTDAPTPPRTVLRVVGQVRGTYVIAEGADGLYLVDQHAAHERVIYERQLAALAHGEGRQPLLVTATVDLPAEDLVVVLDHRADLAALGLELEPFGDGSVLVRCVPAIAVQRDPASLLRFMIQEARGDRSTRSWQDRLAASMACHAAVRAGDDLAPEEMRELLRSLERCTDPAHCAHGRPTMFHLSASQLEREFGRT